MIINLLSILGLQNGLNLQQYLINKQMLLSLTEALAQDIRYQQSGVQIMALMPNINQKNLLREMDSIREIGLQNLLLDLTLDRRGNDLLLDNIDEDRLLGRRELLGRDELLMNEILCDDDLQREQRRDGRRGRMDNDDLRRERSRRMGNQDLLDEDLRRDNRMLNDNLRRDQMLRRDQRMLNDDLLLQQGQRLGGLNLEGRRMMDLLARNMIRCIEMGQNGMLLLVDLEGSRNLQKEMQLSRL